MAGGEGNGTGGVGDGYGDDGEGECDGGGRAVDVSARHMGAMSSGGDDGDESTVGVWPVGEAENQGKR